MAASVNDKITDVRNAARPNSARVSTVRAGGGANLACNDLTGWPTASKVHFVTYQIDTNSNPISNTQLDCYGIVSGSTITNLTVVDGSDGGNSVGDVVEMLPTAAWGQDLADALTNEHSRTGVHTDITADSIIIADGGSIETDIINEATTAAGVTVDGMLIKDSKLATNDSVVTANITDDAVTAAKIENQEAWTAPTYTNSWVNYDAGTYNQGGYMKDSLGFVHLRGLVKNGTDGTSIFTLPAGYRPQYRELLVVGSADLYGRLDILTNGTVVPSAGTTSPSWVCLDGVTFKAYQ